MDKTVFEQEKTHFDIVLKKLSAAKESLAKSMEVMGTENLERLAELKKDPEADPMDVFFFMEQLHEKNAAFNFKDKYQRLEELESLLKEPYFARIDLQKSEEDKKENFYIGKFGYIEESPIITDWRAKVASVYYRYRYPQKQVTYETPQGVETRDLVLKRTFEVDEGIFVRYYNNDIQLDEEEIIIEKIEQRTGGVLEDIVETIQESQLDVIEADPRQVCIVQGCVGSGKSTVAIHKLSHIFFNYPNLIHPERSILIAKNQILVGYLSTLFPKLGIFDINYKTLRELAYSVVFREELKLDMDLDAPCDTALFGVDFIKGLQSSIDKIHDQYAKKTQALFANEDFESFGGFVYSANQTVDENLAEISTDLTEELNHQKALFRENPNAAEAWLYQSNISDLRKLLSEITRLRTDLKNKTLVKLAKSLGLPLMGTLNYSELLLYIYMYAQLIGFKNTLKYEYCVIDEGQDISLLEYLVLSKFVLNGRFCILGDLNQSYSKEGMASWEDIYEVIVEAKSANLFELDTNYRSTVPIINLANSILGPYTQEYLPKSIHRRGANVEITTFAEVTQFIEHFEKEMRKNVANLDKSIGVICFTPELFAQAEDLIQKTQIPADKFVKLNSSQRIRYIPQGVYLSMFEDCKGLEFSKVYVLGLDLGKIHSFEEAKRAFVAVTRAMNELEILSIS